MNTSLSSTSELARQLFSLAASLQKSGADGTTIRDRILEWFKQHPGKHKFAEFHVHIGKPQSVWPICERMEKRGELVRDKEKWGKREIYVYGLPEKGKQ